MFSHTHSENHTHVQNLNISYAYSVGILYTHSDIVARAMPQSDMQWLYSW